jgi:hypothetical protein
VKVVAMGQTCILMGDRKNAYTVLEEKLVKMRPLGSRRRWKT